MFEAIFSPFNGDCCGVCCGSVCFLIFECPECDSCDFDGCLLSLTQYDSKEASRNNNCSFVPPLYNPKFRQVSLS